MHGGYGILLVTILVLVSGFIAYLGDVLGRRMGRRRVTLFGMRPRYTAILISVIAGMLITLITLVAAAAVSKDVRDGLLRAGDMRRRIARLEGDVRKSEQRVSAARSRTERAESEWARARQRLDTARRETSDAAAKLEQVASRLRAVEEARARVDARLAGSQERLSQVQSQYTEASKELTGTRAELADVQKKGESKIFEQGSQILAQLQRLDDLKQQRETLGQEVLSLQEQSRALDKESRALKTQVAKLQQFIGAATPALTQEVVFEVGQELDRQVIDTTQPIAGIREQLDRFVRRVETAVRSAGAGDDQTGHAVILARMMLGEGDSQPRLFEETEILELLARSMHGQGESSVVRCFSMLNVPRGQPVPIHLRVVPNRLLFAKGTELSKVTLDPSQTEARLLAHVVAWMREDVAERARQADILPDLSPPVERTLLFGTPRFSVGRISPECLFALLKEVKRRRSPVTVIAKAAKDTWTTGPLDLDLVVAQESRRKPQAAGLLQLWGAY